MKDVPSHEREESFSPIGGIIGKLARLAEPVFPVEGLKDAKHLPDVPLPQPTDSLDTTLATFADELAKDLETQSQTVIDTLIKCSTLLPFKTHIYASLVALLSRHDTVFVGILVSTICKNITTALLSIKQDYFGTSIFDASNAYTSRMTTPVGTTTSKGRGFASSALASYKARPLPSLLSTSPYHRTARALFQFLAALARLRVISPNSLLECFNSILSNAGISSVLLGSVTTELLHTALPFPIDTLTATAVNTHTSTETTLNPSTETKVSLYVPYADYLVYLVLGCLPHFAPFSIPASLVNVSQSITSSSGHILSYFPNDTSTEDDADGSLSTCAASLTTILRSILAYLVRRHPLVSDRAFVNPLACTWIPSNESTSPFEMSSPRDLLELLFTSITGKNPFTTLTSQTTDIATIADSFFPTSPHTQTLLVAPHYSIRTISMMLQQQLRQVNTRRRQPTLDIPFDATPPRYAGVYIPRLILPSNLSSSDSASSSSHSSSTSNSVPLFVPASPPSSSSSSSSSIRFVGPAFPFRPLLPAVFVPETPSACLDEVLQLEFAGDVFIAYDGLHAERIRALMSLPGRLETNNNEHENESKGSSMSDESSLTTATTFVSATPPKNSSTYPIVVQVLFGNILHQIESSTSVASSTAGVSTLAASAASTLSALFIADTRHFALKMGPYVNAIFQSIGHLSSLPRRRFIDWFARHLVSEGKSTDNDSLRWPWSMWQMAAAQPPTHPARLFIQETLERCSRLAYWQLVCISIASSAPFFLGLVPPAPEQIDVFAAIASRVAQRRKGNNPAKNTITNTAIDMPIEHIALPDDLLTAVSLGHQLVAAAESLVVSKHVAELRGWVDRERKQCALVASALDSNPLVHPALATVTIAILRAGSKSLTHTDVMIERTAGLLKDLLSIKTADQQPVNTTGETNIDPAILAGREQRLAKAKEFELEPISSFVTYAECQLLETVIDFWAHDSQRLTHVLNRLVHYGIIPPKNALAWACYGGFVRAPLGLGVYSTTIWDAITVLLNITLADLSKSSRQVSEAVADITYRRANPDQRLDLTATQTMTDKLDTRAEKVAKHCSDIAIAKADILSTMLKCLNLIGSDKRAYGLAQTEAEATAQVIANTRALLTSHQMHFAESYPLLSEDVKCKNKDLFWVTFL